MFIIATATPFVYVITTEETTKMISETLLSLTSNKILLLLIINILVLFIGSVMEQIPAMLVVVPLLSPLAAQLQINEVQFGLMIVFNLMIGMITPPMGLALYIMAAITDVPMIDIIKQSLRFIFALVAALLLITYIPQLSTFLPRLFGFI